MGCTGCGGRADLLEASMPWSGGGSGSGSGSTGFKLDVKLWNVLGAGDSDTGSRVHSSDPIPEPVFNSETGSRRGVGDEPPPYASVAGDEEEYQDEEAEIWRNEKRSPFPTSEDQFSPEPTRRERDQDSHIVLPSYASVRRNSSNSIRDLLDAIEPPNEPAPAPSSSSLQTPTLLSAGISSGSKVDLQVMQLTASGIGVMMADQKIIHIARHNVIDYGRSGIKSKWEAEVAEGVDLLLAVNIVLIMASSA